MSERVAVLIRDARAGEQRALTELQRRAREQLTAHLDEVYLPADQVDQGLVRVA